MKISFTGDLACDNPLLKGAAIGDKYDFAPVFAQIKYLFKTSDYVVANLETTFPQSKKYNRRAYCYNSPDSFLRAAKEAGINTYTIANNHCMDSGIEGIQRTITLLERENLSYAGCPGKDCILTHDGHTVAILAYTYGVNDNGRRTADAESYVNLLQPIVHIPAKGIKKLIPIRIRRGLRKALRTIKGQPTLKVSIDGLKEADLDRSYLDRIKSDIKRAKKNADKVIVCAHMGGQFNLQIGEFSKYMGQFLIKSGADFVIGNHAHIVQQLERRPAPVAYCLGGLSLSPSAQYLIHDYHPEYSVILHLYLEQEERLTFSIVKGVETKKGMLTVWPLHKLYESETEEGKKRLRAEAVDIYNRFIGTKLDSKEFEIAEEYTIR